MIKALIIDDENHCIITLSHLLAQMDEIKVVATTQDSREGKGLVELFQPDIVFLDVDMPNLDGFSFLAQYETLPFQVIFTTAYNHYAIKALRLNALDYLLKPVDKKELSEAIQKYQEIALPTRLEQVTSAQQCHKGKVQDTIALSTQTGLYFVKIEDIMYLEASGTYTTLVMSNKTKHLVSKTMGIFEEILNEHPHFFRAYKSNILNLKFIQQYIRGEGGEIIMQDNYSIPLSRNKKQAFLDLFNKI